MRVSGEIEKVENREDDGDGEGKNSRVTKHVEAAVAARGKR